MTEGQTNCIPGPVLVVGGGVLAFIGLVACNAYSFLLFHSVAELFSIVVACGIFMVFWNSRGFIQDSFFLLLGTGCLFVAGIDLLHMLAYKGMGVFPRVHPDLAVQLWIAARGLQTASLLLALFFVRRQADAGWMLLGYILVTSALLASIFVWPIFPTCFVEGQGLTPFKKISEYVICVLLVVAGALLYRERNRFDRRVFLLLIASIAAVIVAELAFTFYVNVYGLSTVVGHFAKIIAFCFMYAALIQIGLTKPCDLLLRDVKHNERELASAHRMLQAVLDTTPVRIFWKDRDLTYLGCNKPFAVDAGLASPEEIVGKEDHQLACGEQADLYRADDREVIESGEPKHNYEEPQTGSDGEKLWLRTSKIPLRNESGEVCGVLGCYEDITERKRMESLLIAAAQEWAATFDAVDTMVALLDNNRRVLRCNRAMQDHLGITVDEIRNQTCSNLMHGNAGVPDECPFAEMLRTGRKKTMSLAIGERLMEVAVHPVLDSDGEVTGAVHVVRDITRQRQVEDRLRQGEQRYRSLIHNIAGMVYQGRADWSAEFITGAEALCGYPADGLVSGAGPTWADIIHPEDRGRVFKEAAQLCEEGGDLLQRYRIICKDRSVRWVEDRKSSRHATDGACLGVDGIVFDVTARQRIEEQLMAARRAAEEATRAKSSFVANMSHEIRTPLNAVIGLTHLALKTDLSPLQRDYLGKVRSASHALLAVVNDILDFSKIEAGRLELESTEFALASVTRHLFDVFGLQAEQKGLQLLFKVDADVPATLVGDATRLRQILTNLLGNAIKFTESGQVTLAVRRADGVEAAVSDAYDAPCVTLELSVTDTGVGIPNDQLSTLFQAFSQADTSTTRKFGGTGLGLSICKRLVDMMGGDIQVQSQPAQGSTFSFTAVFGRPERRSGERLGLRDELRGLRVLVVEDDKGSLAALVRSLKALGLSPSPVSSAKEAIAAVSEQPKDAPYELLLVDWHLPQMDGLELCDQLRSDGLTPTLILMSGYWNHELATCLDEGRVDAFLLKPFTPSTLFETILQVFADRLVAGSALLAGAAPESTVPDLRGMRILLAEDNELNQEVALGMLAETGCAVSVARNGTEAVEEFEQTAFELVLMDIQMPEMDGYEATERVRDATADAEFRIPIIAMTAGAMKEDRDRALAAGMDDHIAKPVDPDELYRILGKWTNTGPGRDRGPEPSAPAPTQAKTWETQLRELDAIDVDAALRRFMGDAKRLRAFLRKFGENQASATRDIRAALDAGDVEGAQRLAHTLKGLAGTIGDERLQGAARNVEAALEHGGDDGNARALFLALERRLQGVLDSLAPLAIEPGPAPAAPGADQAMGTGELAPALSRLAGLLQDHNPAALECVQDLATKPLPQPASTALRHLAKLVGRYSFKEALARLGDLAVSLDIDLTGDNTDGNQA